MNITQDEKLNLKKLVDNSECDNNTELIRSLKHSNLIAKDINIFKNIKKDDYQSDEYLEICKTKCNFLYNNYTDIFNKLVKDELDLQIMTKLLVVLQMIEENKVDQHEGSVLVGKILKELYIDSALKCADNLDKKYSKDKPEEKRDTNIISWKEYKNIKK